jgi:hypothetical protein
MSLIIYPDTNYNSWISEDDADLYFETRLNADSWDTANKEAALITAFQSLAELNLTIDPTESEQLKALQEAQLEQSLHELINGTDDSVGISSLSLGGGLLSIKVPESKTPASGHSKRVLAILRSYLSGRSIKRTR